MSSARKSEQYEHHVAAVLRTEGWATTVTRQSRDLGVDVLATREDRRLAVQVKMYGATSTKVNAEQIMCLYGAAAYVDCAERMLATDGRLTTEALMVAKKLGVTVRHIAPMAAVLAPGSAFAELWSEHIEPLAGTTLARGDKTMQILEVDAAGVRRITTGGNPQRIPIDTFRWTVERLLAGKTVTRAEIHERNPRQVSSGVLLILGTVPHFELVSVGRAKALRPRAPAAVTT